ncbi:putative secreted protein (Por secretion system target) [Arcicella aurantiaca]|uniref:Putative secreted protein (Por secretion system target) n=1 Tax=Arcicella aurantiaca TaxID=591202 RepID=A0A316EAL1_9BACT|nr:T9SS type A sorting domain-containing protein [Arcicella aurantiaca]PWK26602.1 putative secreted protein (Por secretion system target) [Arcicella aurantiaca]
MFDIYPVNVIKKGFIFLFFVLTNQVWGQTDCQTAFPYTRSTKNGVVNWQQFPEFSLPFKVVYNGPRFGDSLQLPLKHGFSHLANFNRHDGNLPVKNRAILWGGVASLVGQPWYEIESPWANDLGKYQEKWNAEMRAMAGMFTDTQGKAMPNLDILLLDVEREIPTDAAIRFLKADTTLPAKYRKLSDIDFTERYKIDLGKLYAEPIKYLKANGIPTTTNFASYSDAPVKNSEFPLNYTWQEWQTSDKVLNYYMVDSVSKKVGGEFYKQNTFLAPSAYFCYEYSLLKEYPNIAYQLFQIEANVARSEKEIMLFQWLTYNKCQANSTYRYNTNIKDYLIEAQAIFPFFSGAKGVWLWENPITPDSLNYSSYETYVNSLYRLSQFKDFFIGNHRLVIPKSAYQHFQDRDPVWRGVVKGNEILIAAINEFANDNETTDLLVSYGGWSQKIQLKGKQTFLCKFPLPDLQTNYLLYPNPSRGTFIFEFFGDNFLTGNLKIVDIFGREVLNQNLTGNSRKQSFDLKLTSGSYFLNYVEGEKVIMKKIIIE